LVFSCADPKVGVSLQPLVYRSCSRSQSTALA
jgi:hypothetical protein